jgi:hypothetical protein
MGIHTDPEPDPDLALPCLLYLNFLIVALKVPSHQIRLGLKCNGWIRLGECKDLKW